MREVKANLFRGVAWNVTRTVTSLNVLSFDGWAPFVAGA